MRRLILLFSLVAAACAHYPENAPLCKPDVPPGNCKIDLTQGYRYTDLTLPRLDDTFVILTFSGGGTRAAGFAYGVLRAMEQTKMPSGRTLLDYIDVISSVSGGSFTAMQFGLKGRGGLDELKTRFLDKNIQGMLFNEVFLNPRNWIRLLSPTFHRIDLAQEIYDRELFDNVDFKHLREVQSNGGRPRPLIIANSTELEIGSRFEWTQDQFDPICSDLSGVHVARAVAASSAFPGLLSPMAVNSYPTRCQYDMPQWVPNARQDEAVNPDRTRSAIELESYVDPKRQFLHVMDGGIVDNIGLRGPLHALTSTDTFVKSDGTHTGFTIQGDLNPPAKIKKLFFIVVTAEPDSRSVQIDSRQQVPGIFTVINNVINTPMGNVSFDTIDLLLQTLQSKDIQQRDPIGCQQLAQAQCPNVKIPGGDQPQIGYYKTVVSFPLVSNAELRGRLNQIGTNFDLKPGQLDDLVTAARDVTLNSDDYKRFVADLGGTMPP